jgi:hypothetical protein
LEARNSYVESDSDEPEGGDDEEEDYDEDDSDEAADIGYANTISPEDNETGEKLYTIVTGPTWKMEIASRSGHMKECPSDRAATTISNVEEFAQAVAANLRFYYELIRILARNGPDAHREYTSR